MKKIILVFFYLSISCVSFSQIYGKYSIYKVNESDVNCILKLYQDSKYELFIYYYETEDNAYEVLISYGKYSLDKSKLTLNDLYNKYSLVFNYNNNSLIGIKTFKWLKDKKLTKTDKLSKKGDFSKIKTRSFKYEKKETSQLPLKECLIIPSYFRNKYDEIVEIKGNHTYSFGFKDFILSEGTWSLDGNELVLYDTTLEYKFYAFIKNETLELKFFPIEYPESTILKKGFEKYK